MGGAAEHSTSRTRLAAPAMLQPAGGPLTALGSMHRHRPVTNGHLRWPVTPRGAAALARRLPPPGGSCAIGLAEAHDADNWTGISLLTNDITGLYKRLRRHDVAFEGPPVI